MTGTTTSLYSEDGAHNLINITAVVQVFLAMPGTCLQPPIDFVLISSSLDGKIWVQ
jgi:hypothetical protein